MLKDWFGADIPEIAHFGYEIALEAYSFGDIAGKSGVAARTSGRALNRARHLWFERLPKMF
jgi:hypothetical protein